MSLILKRQWIFLAVALSLMLGVAAFAGALSTTTAQDEEGDLADRPVAIHAGTCTDFEYEPVHEVGTIQVTNVAAEGEQEVGDTEAEIPAEAEDLGDVYYLSGSEADINGTELVGSGPHIVAVHQSEENRGTLVSCGQLLDIQQGENYLVPMLPVGESEWTGVAFVPQEGGGNMSAYLWQCDPLEQVVIEEPTVVVEVTEIVEDTEIIEETEVIEVTEVVEETEVVQVTEVIEVTEEVAATEIIEVTEEIEVTEVVTDEEVVLASTATAMAEESGEPQDTGEMTTVELNGEQPGTITVQAGQSFLVNNTSDNERTLRIADLGIDETIPGGQELEVIIPDGVDAGTYSYEFLDENDETLFEGDLQVE